MFDSAERKTREEEHRIQKYGQEDLTLRAGLSEERTETIRFQDDTDNVRFSEDFEDEKSENLVNELKNHVKDNSGNWVKQKTLIGYDKDDKPIYGIIPPKINELGVMMILGLARPYFHRNMINSNFKDTHIMYMLKKTKRTLRRALIIHANKYGLSTEPSTTELDEIIDTVLNHIKPTPFRALNDGERKHKRTYIKKLEASMEGNQPQKKRFLW